MANLRLGRPVVARRLVTAAREHFETSGDVLSAAESMGMEAQAAYLLQEPAALPLAEAALGMVRSITPVPPSTEAQLLMVLASVHLMRRSWHEAIELYQEAIAVGDVLVSSATLGFARRSTPIEVNGISMHRPGTILGKALEPLKEGTGEILVLLTLQ